MAHPVPALLRTPELDAARAEVARAHAVLRARTAAADQLIAVGADDLQVEEALSELDRAVALHGDALAKLRDAEKATAARAPFGVLALARGWRLVPNTGGREEAVTRYAFGANGRLSRVQVIIANERELAYYDERASGVVRVEEHITTHDGLLDLLSRVLEETTADLLRAGWVYHCDLRTVDELARAAGVRH